MEVVYWDLETTGLDAVNKHVDIEILEIGAISETGLKFQQYLLPSAPIPRDSSKVHGIYLKKKPGRRGQKRGYDMTKLYFKKEGGRLVQVNAVDKKTGLKMFLDWLKGFDKKILLAGYNNHNFDDWVLAHNLLQVDLDVSELGVQFGDVAKVVRPLLNKEFDTKKWKLGFAVDCLLKRDQSLAHGALSDAEDARDLLMKIAEKKEVDTRDILEETMGESNERLRALKDFDEVMKVCVGMFMNSGAGMARSVTREDRMKDKWKKFADKKKMVKEQQLVEKKGKKAKSPKKVSPSNGVETNKICPKPLKCTEEWISVEKFKSNVQKENMDSVKVVEEKYAIPDKQSGETAEKNKLQNVVEEAKIHKSGLIMASDLPKRMPSVSSNKISTTLGQTKYQQTKLNFGTAPKTITSQTSSTTLTTASAKVVGASSNKTTSASLAQRTDSSVNKAAVVSSNKLSGEQCAKTKVGQNRKINENKNSNTPRLPPKQQQDALSTKNITKITSVSLIQPALSENYLNSELDRQAAENKLNMPDLECSIPLDEWDQSFQLDQSCQDGPKQELNRWDQSCKVDPITEIDRWDQSCQNDPITELDEWDQSCQDGPKQEHNRLDQSCQGDPITEFDEWDQSFQVDQSCQDDLITELDEWDQSFQLDQSYKDDPNKYNSSNVVKDCCGDTEDLKKENEGVKDKESLKPFIVEMDPSKTISKDRLENITFHDKILEPRVENDVFPIDQVVSKLASDLNNISVCNHKSELSDIFTDSGSECGENDDMFDSEMSDIIDEITGKKSL